MGNRGQAQGDDEFEYEEDFQDDEEGIARVDDLVGEDEQKEIEVRDIILHHLIASSPPLLLLSYLLSPDSVSDDAETNET